MTSDLPKPGSFKKITSLGNPLVKEIRALQQKKHRDESGLFIAEGQKLVRDAVDGGWPVEMLAYAAANAGEAPRFPNPQALPSFRSSPRPSAVARISSSR